MTARTRRGRGPQRTPTKVPISLRVDPETLAIYRATGRGWQSRLNADITAAAKRRARRSTP